MTAASLVIVIAALKVARPVLVPLTVSAFLAVLTAPFVLYLKKHRVPPHFGVPLVVLVTVLVISGIAGLVIGTLNTFVQEIPSYQARVMEMLTSASSQLESFGIQLTLSSLTSLVEPAAAMQFSGNTLSEIADLLSNTFLVLLMTIFVLFEAMVLPDKIRNALSDPNADLSQGIRVVGRIKAYVVIKTSTSLATGVIIGGALQLMGVDFALLWGLLAFLFNFIPNIGSIVAAIPAIILALLQAGPTGALATAIVFIVVNMVIGSLLEPKIMGERMNLSPLVVFFSLVFWGWLWGPIGMLLSVPLTMTIRIMLEGNKGTRPFAILMAGASAPDGGPPTMRSG
jgi:predicted PurR-regulated permease PerM